VSERERARQREALERDRQTDRENSHITSSSPSLKTDKAPAFLPEIEARKPGANCADTFLLHATNAFPSSSTAAVSSSLLEKITVCLCVCVCARARFGKVYCVRVCARARTLVCMVCVCVWGGGVSCVCVVCVCHEPESKPLLKDKRRRKY
jgi:hypothetical protein